MATSVSSSIRARRRSRQGLEFIPQKRPLPQFPPAPFVYKPRRSRAFVTINYALPDFSQIKPRTNSGLHDKHERARNPGDAMREQRRSMQSASGTRRRHSTVAITTNPQARSQRENRRLPPAVRSASGWSRSAARPKTAAVGKMWAKDPTRDIRNRMLTESNGTLASLRIATRRGAKVDSIKREQPDSVLKLPPQMRAFRPPPSPARYFPPPSTPNLLFTLPPSCLVRILQCAVDSLPLMASLCGTCSQMRAAVHRPLALRFLSVDASRATDRQCGQLAKPPGFGWLNLTHSNDVSDLGAESLGRMTSLERLNLSYCTGLTDNGLSVLFARLPRLTCLNLYGCAAVCGGSLAALGRCAQLQTLDLTHCTGVTDAAVVALCEGGRAQLTELNLYGCSAVGDAGVAAIFQHLSSLRRLNLSWTNVTDSALLPLPALPLQQLGLSGCEGVTTAGLGFVGQLAGLRHLTLRYCPNLTDEGLAQLMPLSQLVNLGLCGCESITDAGLLALVAALPMLAELSMRGCFGISHHAIPPISKRGIKLLMTKATAKTGFAASPEVKQP